ncbi:hypothetical protein F4U94_03655 [Sphingobium limneticum]|nr:hypothetical protein F4U94_03655 [Sphingobium limneticum]
MRLFSLRRRNYRDRSGSRIGKGRMPRTFINMFGIDIWNFDVICDGNFRHDRLQRGGRRCADAAEQLREVCTALGRHRRSLYARLRGRRKQHGLETGQHRHRQTSPVRCMRR